MLKLVVIILLILLVILNYKNIENFPYVYFAKRSRPILRRIDKYHYIPEPPIYLYKQYY